MHEDRNLDIVTEDGQVWPGTPEAPTPKATSSDAIQQECQGGTRSAAQGGQPPQPPGSEPHGHMAPAGRTEAQWVSPAASPQTTLTFSNRVFEAAFLASDFDKVVWTEPQARVSHSVLTSAFMVGMSQQGPASGSGGLQASRAHGDHRPHGVASAHCGTGHHRAEVFVYWAGHWPQD